MDDDADLQCLSYDITPVVAAFSSASTYSVAVTKCWRWVFTGGSDGRITKWDFFGSLNGKSMLTQIQRGAMVESVSKGGHILSFWYQEDPIDPRSQTPTLGNASPTFKPVVNGSIKSALLPSSSPSLIASGINANPIAGLSHGSFELSPVYSLALHSEAQWVLSGSKRGNIYLYSARVDEGKCVFSMQGHQDAVSCLKLNREETKVLSGSWDSKVMLWDLNTGLPQNSFTAHNSQISALEWHPSDPHMFITSSVNGVCYQWDIRTSYKPSLEFALPEKTPPWILSSCYNPVNHHVYVGRRNNTVDEYAPTGEFVRTLTLPRNSGLVTKLYCMENGRHLLIASIDSLRLWDLEHTGKGVPFTIVSGNHGGCISELIVDPDSRFLFAGCGHRGWDSIGKDSPVSLIYTLSGIY